MHSTTYVKGPRDEHDGQLETWVSVLVSCTIGPIMNLHFSQLYLTICQEGRENQISF